MVSGGLVGKEFALVLELWVVSLVAVNAVFDVTAETSDQTLHGPGGGIAQSADSVALDLVRKLFKHVNLGEVGVSELHSLEHVDHPAGSFAAWGALAATLVLVELGKAEDCVNYVCLVVNHDDGGGSET